MYIIIIIEVYIIIEGILIECILLYIIIEVYIIIEGILIQCLSLHNRSY